MTSRSSTDAQLFRGLHHDGLLTLANAWDAGSARLIESLGAKAVATTSAGVAWSLGYADGELLPTPMLISAIANIARVIRVPLTADVEGGYSSDPAAVGALVVQVIEAGAVGINLEDGAGAPDLLCAKIEQVKRSGAKVGVDVFVNARTDVYLRSLAPEDRRVEETLERAKRYRAAGADGIFVPGVVNTAEIKAIASGVGIPLNVLAWPGLGSAAELQRLGVRRLSSGSGIAQAVLGQAAALAADFLRGGSSAPLSANTMTYAQINALLLGR